MQTDAARVNDFLGDIIDAIRRVLDDMLAPLDTLLADLLAGLNGYIGDFLGPLFADLTNTINALVANITKGIGDAIAPILQPINDLIGSLDDTIWTLLTQVKDVIAGIDDSIIGAVNTLVSGLQNSLNYVANTLASTVTSLYDQITYAVDSISGEVTRAIASIGNVVSGAIRDVSDTISTAFASVGNTISGALNGAVNSIGVWISDAYLTVSDTLTRVTDTLSASMQAVVDGITDTVGGISDGINSIPQWLGDNVTGPVQGWWNNLESIAQNVEVAFYDMFLGPFAEMPEIPEPIRNFIASIAPKKNALLALGAFAVLPMVIQPLISAVYGPFVAHVEHLSSSVARTNLLTAPQLIEGYYRGILDNERVQWSLAAQGYNQGDIDGIIKLFEHQIPVAEAFGLYRRGLLSKPEMLTELGKQGYTDSLTERLLTASEYLPNIPDLVRFSVRDAYNDAASQKYGYDEDYPQQFERDAAALGMSPEWSKRYWRAHWELPSPTAGYEMFHRGIIDEPTLKELLLVSDYPRYWRDKMMQLSYNPITRVDIRRIHKTLGKDHSWLVRQYQNVGYSPDDAETLAAFTEVLNAGEVKVDKAPQRDLVRGQIEYAYKNLMIDRPTSASMLLGLGYDSEETEFTLASVDLKRTVEIYERKIDIAKRMYVVGQLDEIGLLGKLSELNLPNEQVKLIHQEIVVDNIHKPRIPSMKDLLAMVKSKLISEKDFADTLGVMGYSPYWAERMVKIKL